MPCTCLVMSCISMTTFALYSSIHFYRVQNYWDIKAKQFQKHMHFLYSNSHSCWWSYEYWWGREMGVLWLVSLFEQLIGQYWSMFSQNQCIIQCMIQCMIFFISFYFHHFFLYYTLSVSCTAQGCMLCIVQCMRVLQLWKFSYTVVKL